MKNIKLNLIITLLVFCSAYAQPGAELAELSRRMSELKEEFRDLSEIEGNKTREFTRDLNQYILLKRSNVHDQSTILSGEVDEYVRRLYNGEGPMYLRVAYATLRSISERREAQKARYNSLKQRYEECCEELRKSD